MIFVLLKNIKNFVKKQFFQIKSGGTKILFNKVVLLNKIIINRIIDLLLYVISIPIVLVARLISPLYLVRFGYIVGARIGHFVFDVEYYLSQKKLGLHPRRSKDVFFYRWGKPANSYFSKLAKRNLIILSFAKYLYKVNKYIPGGKKNFIETAHTYGSRDIYGYYRQCDVQLKFNLIDNDRGNAYLNELGIKKSDKYICLQVRDSKYLEEFHSHGVDWSYHDFRDSNIDSYEEAILALIDKGYWVFRMGKIVKEPLKINHPNVIDYANSENRNDFLDIWLMANSYFTISTSSGLDDVSKAFRKPMVYVNFLPIGLFEFYGNNYINQPKYLKSKITGEYISLLELIKMEAIKPNIPPLSYEKLNIEVIDNTSEDIKNAVMEMEAKLSGTWNVEEKDENLQRLFFKQYNTWLNRYKYHGNIDPLGGISTTFLRKYHSWFLAE